MGRQPGHQYVAASWQLDIRKTPKERNVSDTQEFRLERDSMGEFSVPVDAYYGANTMRAVLNFPISDLRFGRSFIRAISSIKLAAAEVNRETRTAR